MQLKYNFSNILSEYQEPCVNSEQIQNYVYNIKLKEFRTPKFSLVTCVRKPEVLIRVGCEAQQAVV